jgi:hypothetical protein
MPMKFTDLEAAQNQSFYIKWKTKDYQVFYSASAGMKELRFNGKKVRCKELRVKPLPDVESTRVVVPRSCIPKAPNALKFQGVATAGVFSVDETAVSAKVARG